MRPLPVIIALFLAQLLVASAFGPNRRLPLQIHWISHSFGWRGVCPAKHPTRVLKGSAISEDSFPPSPESPPRPAPPRLTVLLPAFNEASRIESTLRTYQAYLELSPLWGARNQADLLVVDDGSTDGTADVVRRLAVELADDVGNGQNAGRGAVPVQCVSLSLNKGKGGAISRGMEEVARRRNEEEGGRGGGSLVLVADADGSGDIACLDGMVDALASLIEQRHQPKVDEAFWDRPALVVGDRGYEGAGLARSVLRWGFRTAVRLLCGDLGVRDTQCGLKLMTLSAGSVLYHDLNLQRWTHDVEVLYRARELDVPIIDRAVRWEDRDGSKLVTSPGGAVGASASMLLEIVRMRLEYAFGRWRIQ